MDYQFFAILLLLLGIVLIVAEVFLPSGGMILILCTIAFVSSFWCATKAWYGTEPIAFGIYIASLVVLIPSVLVGAFQLFPRTPFGRQLMAVPTLEEVTPYADERQHLAGFVGRIAKAVTPLTPGGLVSIDSERLHAFSEGVLIERDTAVEIIDVRGTRVVVREATEEALVREREVTEITQEMLVKTDTPDESDDPTEPPLDFAVPQG